MTVQLILYVSEGSPASLRASRIIKQRIAKHPELDVTLEIRDVATHADDALAQRVAFTPTLLRIAPGPALRLVGDFRDPQALEDLFTHEERPTEK